MEQGSLVAPSLPSSVILYQSALSTRLPSFMQQFVLQIVVEHVCTVLGSENTLMSKAKSLLSCSLCSGRGDSVNKYGLL